MNNMKTDKKKAPAVLAAIILCTCLYVVSLWPLFFVSVLLLMSIAFADVPIVYITIVAYLLSIIVGVLGSIYWYVKRRYETAVKTILTPLFFAILFVLAFYFRAMQFEG